MSLLDTSHSGLSCFICLLPAVFDCKRPNFDMRMCANFDMPINTCSSGVKHFSKIIPKIARFFSTIFKNVYVSIQCIASLENHWSFCHFWRLSNQRSLTSFYRKRTACNSIHLLTKPFVVHIFIVLYLSRPGRPSWQKCPKLWLYCTVSCIYDFSSLSAVL